MFVGAVMTKEEIRRINTTTLAYLGDAVFEVIVREKIVTDTTVYVGSDGNLLEPKDSNCKVLQINNPSVGASPSDFRMPSTAETYVASCPMSRGSKSVTLTSTTI